MKILIVLTSHDRLGNTGKPTGFWLEEFAAPYYVLKDAGIEITVASPKGGQPPVDPRSDEPGNQTEAMARFKQDPAAQEVLANTVKLSEVKADDYDTVFYPGGHGPMSGQNKIGSQTHDKVQRIDNLSDAAEELTLNVKPDDTHVDLVPVCSCCLNPRCGTDPDSAPLSRATF